MGKLDGKVIIVSGAGYGLGRGIALRLGYEGACVATIGRTEEKLVDFQRQMQSRGYPAMYMVGDISCRETVNEFVRKVVLQWGRIDALVNNAMIQNRRTIMETTEEDMVSCWNVCVKGSIYLMQACYPHFKINGHGKVVNFGSMAAELGHYNRTPYAAAKGAVAGLTRVAAREWGWDNIQVNTIAPAIAPLPVSNVTPPPEIAKLSSGTRCVKNFAADYEKNIGGVVAFLCSEDSDWVTSRLIFVDGGQGARR